MDSIGERLDRIEKLVTRSCVSAERAADMSMQTHEKLNALEQITEAHGVRIKRLEVKEVWAPLILSSVAALSGVMALAMVVYAMLTILPRLSP